MAFKYQVIQVIQCVLNNRSMKDTPQIRIGRSPGEFQNSLKITVLPTDTKFGNLFRKAIKIDDRADRINLMIQEIFALHSKITSDLNQINPPINEYDFKIEEVFYWLNKTADELIAIVSLLDFRVAHGVYPDKIKIHEIGILLNPKKLKTELTDAHRRVLNYQELLTKLNEVSNAYKHSFVQSEVDLISFDEPVAFVLPLKFCDLKNRTNLQHISIRKLIADYDQFYRSMLEQSRTLTRAIVPLDK